MGKTLEVSAPIVMIGVENGKIVCNPWQMEVRRGENVQFNCASAFAVHFSGKTPFPQVSLRGSRSIKTGTIPDDMPYETYKYFVAVYENGQVLTADPDIIIVP